MQRFYNDRLTSEQGKFLNLARLTMQPFCKDDFKINKFIYDYL